MSSGPDKSAHSSLPFLPNNKITENDTAAAVQSIVRVLSMVNEYSRLSVQNRWWHSYSLSYPVSSAVPWLLTAGFRIAPQVSRLQLLRFHWLGSYARTGLTGIGRRTRRKRLSRLQEEILGGSENESVSQVENGIGDNAAEFDSASFVEGEEQYDNAVEDTVAANIQSSGRDHAGDSNGKDEKRTRPAVATAKKPAAASLPAAATVEPRKISSLSPPLSYLANVVASRAFWSEASRQILDRLARHNATPTRILETAFSSMNGLSTLRGPTSYPVKSRAAFDRSAPSNPNDNHPDIKDPKQLQVLRISEARPGESLNPLPSFELPQMKSSSPDESKGIKNGDSEDKEGTHDISGSDKLPIPTPLPRPLPSASPSDIAPKEGTLSSNSSPQSSQPPFTPLQVLSSASAEAYAYARPWMAASSMLEEARLSSTSLLLPSHAFLPSLVLSSSLSSTTIPLLAAATTTMFSRPILPKRSRVVAPSSVAPGSSSLPYGAKNLRGLEGNTDNSMAERGGGSDNDGRILRGSTVAAAGSDAAAGFFAVAGSSANSDKQHLPDQHLAHRNIDSSSITKGGSEHENNLPSNARTPLTWSGLLAGTVEQRLAGLGFDLHTELKSRGVDSHPQPATTTTGQKESSPSKSAVEGSKEEQDHRGALPVNEVLQTTGNEEQEQPAPLSQPAGPEILSATTKETTGQIVLGADALASVSQVANQFRIPILANIILQSKASGSAATWPVSAYTAAIAASIQGYYLRSTGANAVYHKISKSRPNPASRPAQTRGDDIPLNPIAPERQEAELQNSSVASSPPPLQPVDKPPTSFPGAPPTLASAATAETKSDDSRNASRTPVLAAKEEDARLKKNSGGTQNPQLDLDEALHNYAEDLKEGGHLETSTGNVSHPLVSIAASLHPMEWLIHAPTNNIAHLLIASLALKDSIADAHAIAGLGRINATVFLLKQNAALYGQIVRYPSSQNSPLSQEASFAATHPKLGISRALVLALGKGLLPNAITKSQELHPRNNNSGSENSRDQGPLLPAPIEDSFRQREKSDDAQTAAPSGPATTEATRSNGAGSQNAYGEGLAPSIDDAVKIVEQSSKIAAASFRKDDDVVVAPGTMPLLDNGGLDFSSIDHSLEVYAMAMRVGMTARQLMAIQNLPQLMIMNLRYHHYHSPLLGKGQQITSNERSYYLQARKSKEMAVGNAAQDASATAVLLSPATGIDNPVQDVESLERQSRQPSSLPSFSYETGTPFERADDLAMDAPVLSLSLILSSITGNSLRYVNGMRAYALSGGKKTSSQSGYSSSLVPIVPNSSLASIILPHPPSPSQRGGQQKSAGQRSRQFSGKGDGQAILHDGYPEKAGWSSGSRKDSVTPGYRSKPPSPSSSPTREKEDAKVENRADKMRKKIERMLADEMRRFGFDL